MIRIVDLPPRTVEAQLALLQQRFHEALCVDAERGRTEAAKSQDRLRQMGRVELAELREIAVGRVVWFEVRAANDWVGALLWPELDAIPLMHSPTDGAWTLADEAAVCLGGRLEEE
jgi:hypothetical protein